MAAITPNTIVRESLGSLTLLIASFSAGTADDGDTWTTGLGTNVVGFWSQDTENPTTQASVGVAITCDVNVFTFYPAEDNKAFDVFVLTRI